MHTVRESVAESAAPRGEAKESRAFLLLVLLGAAITASVLVTPLAFRAGGDFAYIALALATGLIAAAATGVAERAPARRALWLILGVALALRVVLLFTEPLLSTDIYRYVWDGRVQAAGINPYRFVPADAALATLRDAAIYPNINRVDYAVTIYPPIAQMFFFLVTRVSESVTAMKLALLVCDAATVALVLLLLRRLGRPPARVVAYAWHPLPLWEVANSGHVDALMVALMMLGIWLAIGGRPLRGAGAVALSALAKPYAVLALPALWRPFDWRMPLLVLAVVAACYVPYLSVGWGVLGFAGGYVSEEGLKTGDLVWLLAVWREVFGTLPGDYYGYLAGSAVALAALALVAARRHTRSAETTLADINRLLLVFLFLISPNYPWYFLALTPFVALLGGAPLWVITVGAVLLQEEAAWDPNVPVLIRKSVHFGAFLLACALVVWGAQLSRLVQGRMRPRVS